MISDVSGAGYGAVPGLREHAEHPREVVREAALEDVRIARANAFPMANPINALTLVYTKLLCVRHGESLLADGGYAA
jgi:hypothetical protein